MMYWYPVCAIRFQKGAGLSQGALLPNVCMASLSRLQESVMSNTSKSKFYLTVSLFRGRYVETPNFGEELRFTMCRSESVEFFAYECELRGIVFDRAELLAKRSDQSGAYRFKFVLHQYSDANEFQEWRAWYDCEIGCYPNERPYLYGFAECSIPFALFNDKPF
jgi:hypothetical protein